MIKAGDLVLVVKPMPCCGNDSINGMIFLVQSTDADSSYCVICGRTYRDPVAVVERRGAVLLSRLKRIPPLAELESTETKEVLHA